MKKSIAGVGVGVGLALLVAPQVQADVISYAENSADVICNELALAPKPSTIDAMLSVIQDDGFSAREAKAIVGYGIDNNCYEGKPLGAKVAWQNLTGQALG